MSKEVYQELLAAGVPALPDGMYYRISESDFGDYGILEVYKTEVVKRFHLWESVNGTRVGRSYYFEFTSDPLVGILRAATEWWESYKREQKKESNKEKAAHFFGRHP